jgi:hypothetical protein
MEQTEILTCQHPSHQNIIYLVRIGCDTAPRLTALSPRQHNNLRIDLHLEAWNLDQEIVACQRLESRMSSMQEAYFVFHALPFPRKNKL